jgi:hypothetical protein
MRRKGLTLGEIDRLLLQLGFARRVLPSQHRVFHDSASDTWVTLPAARYDADLSPHHTIATRKILIERGVIGEDELDDLIQEMLRSPTASMSG